MMQFGRFPTDTRKKIPNDWTEQVTKTLTEAYYAQSQKDERFFDVYGEIADKEIIVIISYLHHKDQMASPISLFITHDLVDDSKKFQSTLKNLLDLTGEIFDDIFSHQEWSDYIAHWTENKFNDSVFFYKITRENISLTLQAEEILKNDAMEKFK